MPAHVALAGNAAPVDVSQTLGVAACRGADDFGSWSLQKDLDASFRGSNGPTGMEFAVDRAREPTCSLSQMGGQLDSLVALKVG